MKYKIFERNEYENQIDTVEIPRYGKTISMM
jgi:hypothetical protein